MRSSADLAGDVSDRVDLDHLAVLVGEYSDGSALLGLLVGHLLANHGDLRLDGIVDELLQLGQLLGGDLPVQVEVESEPLGGDVRTLLLDVRGHDLPQSGVEQVGRGMQLGGLDGMVGESSLELLVGTHPGVLLVGFEAVVEVGLVDLLPCFSRQLLCELDGESECIVEAEDRCPVQDLGVAGLGDHLVEPPQSLGEGLVELLLLGGEVGEDELAVPGELGVRLGVLGDDDLRDLLHADLVDAQLGEVSAGSPDEPSEDVSLSDLGGNDSVAEHEGGCAEVVGDDPERLGVVGVLAVLLAGELLDLPDDPGEQRGVVDRPDAV